MQTVTVHFVGGKSFAIRMHKHQAHSLLKALAANPDGATIISNDTGDPLQVIHRSQVTFAEITE